MIMSIIKRALCWALMAILLLLSIYFGLLTLLSGWDFAKLQFFEFWYFIVALAIGFGLQVGMFVYLKNLIHGQMSKGVVVATGSTSTIAMISCCAHYLVNIIPILGVTGFVSVVAQYQVELFWFGLVSNLFGIIYIARKIYQFHKKIWQ